MQSNTDYPYTYTAYKKPVKRKELKPAGHSALIEKLVHPAIVVASTLLSAIAAYVLAHDEIVRAINRRATPADWFIIVLCVGSGLLLDIALIVAATRYMMHSMRADPRERNWHRLAKWVLIVCMVSETMTLFYFFVQLDPAAFPPLLVKAADLIHAVLSVLRAFLPPAALAYFVAGIQPISYDRADRNREIKSRTSSNIMLLVDDLSAVAQSDDPAEKIRALGGQLSLNTYATYDETTRTTEAQQLQRDAKLLAQLGRIHGVDWSGIAADVAPELNVPAPATTQQPQPQPQSQQVALPQPQYRPPREAEHTAAYEPITDEQRMLAHNGHSNGHHFDVDGR